MCVSVCQSSQGLTKCIYVCMCQIQKYFLWGHNFADISYPANKVLSAMRKHGGRALLAEYPRHQGARDIYRPL